jgi:hypothetical protein
VGMPVGIPRAPGPEALDLARILCALLQILP